MVMLTNNFTHGQLCLRERHEVVKMQTQQKKVYAGRLFEAEASFINCWST